MLMPRRGSNDPTVPKNYDPTVVKGQKNPETGGPMIGWLGNKGGQGGGGNPTPGLLSAFLPGQKSALASQLSQGFGGPVKQWSGILGQAYSDMQLPTAKYGYRVPDKPTKKPGEKDDDKDGGKGGGGDGKDDPYVWNSHSAIGYNFAPNAISHPGASFQSITGPAQAQMGGMGGLGGMQPQSINPQLLAMFRQRLMGG